MAQQLSLQGLDFDRYFFTETVFTANPRFNPDNDTDKTPVTYKLEHELECVTLSPTVFGVSLTLESNNEQAPYFYKVSAFARIKSEKEGREKDAAALGLQILYGSIREHILSLSLRGPWSHEPVILAVCDVGGLMGTAKYSNLAEEKKPG